MYINNFGILCSQNESDNFICECEDGRVDRFPTFEFMVTLQNNEKKIFTLEPEFYVHAIKNQCLLMVGSFKLDEVPSEWKLTLLGLPFMRKYFTIFNIE